MHERISAEGRCVHGLLYSVCDTRVCKAFPTLRKVVICKFGDVFSRKAHDRCTAQRWTMSGSNIRRISTTEDCCWERLQSSTPLTFRVRWTLLQNTKRSQEQELTFLTPFNLKILLVQIMCVVDVLQVHHMRIVKTAIQQCYYTCALFIGCKATGH